MLLARFFPFSSLFPFAFLDFDSLLSVFQQTLSKLRASGLLDADACAAKLAALDAQLTQLRAKRRRLLRNDDISEMAETLRQTMDTLHQGPERLEEFDEALFAELVEKIVVSPTALRFLLNGGFEVTERLWEGER